MPTIAEPEARLQVPLQRVVRSPSRRNGDRAAAAASTAKPLQLRGRETSEKSTTLERSMLYNTTSAMSNSRRPAPQYFAAPLSPPPVAPLPQFPMSIPSSAAAISPPAAAKARQNEDFLWTISRTGEAGTVLPPFAEQPRPAPQPPKRRPRTPGEEFRVSPVSTPLRRGLSNSQRSNISRPALVPLATSTVQLPSQQQQQRPTSVLDPHLITAQRFVPTTAPQSPSALFTGESVQQPAIQNSSTTMSAAARLQKSGRGRRSISKTPAMPYPMIRSHTAPPTYNRTVSSISRSTASSSTSSSSRRTGRSRFTRRDVAARRSLDAHPAAASRLAPTSSIRSALSLADDLSRLKTRSDAIAKPSSAPSTPGSIIKSPFKKSRKGETMSMLLNTGFFPVEELIYGKDVSTVSKLRQSQMYRINLPPRLSFLGDDDVLTALRSPNNSGGGGDSPTDSLSSPKSPTFPRRSYRKARNRRSGMVRSPLTQISENKVASTVDEQDEDEDEEEEEGQDRTSSRNTLAAIAEDPAWGDEENIAPEIGSAMPAARAIHLRGGSVVTVTPPEMTAWRCSIYIPGAIKLPKPAIMPRKNSVATLDPFQHAVDDMYQLSLAVPRRRSDDAVVDDICDFFDGFGFDVNIGFDGDCLGFAHVITDEASNIGEVMEEEEGEGFSTPTLEPSPIEIEIAKEVLDSTTKAQQAMMQASRRPPPVETEETLRARGIARLSRGSAASISSLSSSFVGPPSPRESLLLGSKAGVRSGSVSLLLPAPEGSMFETVRGKFGTSATAGSAGDAKDSPRSGGRAGFAGITTATTKTATTMATEGPLTTPLLSSSSGFDVQEISVSSAWVAPEAVSKVGSSNSASSSSRRTRTPLLSRFRKAKASASSAL